MAVDNSIICFLSKQIMLLKELFTYLPINKTMKDTQYQEKISENKLKNSNQKISWKTQQQKIIIQTKSRKIKTRVKVNSLWCKHSSPNSAV